MRFAAGSLLTVAALALGASSSARAAGTFGVVEGRVGAIVDGSPGRLGPAWGASLGGTFRLGRSPIRLYLLANGDARQWRRSGGGEATALDVGGVLRFVVPLPFASWNGPLRVLAEVGGGVRYVEQSLELRTVPLSQRTWAPAGLVGLGLQLRTGRHLSFLARVTYSGHVGRDDLAHVLYEAPTDLAEATLGLGVHF